MVCINIPESHYSPIEFEINEERVCFLELNDQPVQQILNQQGKEEIDSQMLYVSSEELMDKRKILDPFNQSYSQEWENAAQDDGIKRVCDIELHLVVPVVEEYFESNIFQIIDEFVALETFNLDLHEETFIHVASDFEDVRFQIDDHELQESSDKKEIV